MRLLCKLALWVESLWLLILSGVGQAICAAIAYVGDEERAIPRRVKRALFGLSIIVVLVLAALGALLWLPLIALLAWSPR